MTYRALVITSSNRAARGEWEDTSGPILVAGLAQLGFDDFFLRHGAESMHKADFFEEPDRPFGRVELPGLHAVAIIVLKFMVEVVVALAKRENRHEQAVACRDIAGIRTLADPVAERVDAKGHVMHEHDPRHASN